MFVKLSHHRHTGRLRPHHETSYALLVFLVMVTAVVATLFNTTAEAALGPTKGGSYTVQAVVPAPKPTQAVIITSPTAGQTFQANPVTVTGTCPKGTLIKIFKNGILAGSVLCDASGKFTVPIDLLIGSNALTAVAFNTNDQGGPEAPAVNVTLNVPAGSFGFSGELLLQSINYYRGVVPGQEVVWPITIVGGVGPYAVNFEWGDGTSDLITRLSAGPFTLSHTYKKVGGYLGSYPLVIRATDAGGHTAYLQLTTIVNDPKADTASVVKAGPVELGGLMVIWPLIIVLLFIIFAFWLGERREKHIMMRQLAAVS